MNHSKQIFVFISRVIRWDLICQIYCAATSFPFISCRLEPVSPNTTLLVQREWLIWPRELIDAVMTLITLDAIDGLQKGRSTSFAYAE
jgi:hypothetical protein